MAVEAHATAKYVRTSAQKAGLVLDLIRGRDVNHALATLRFARKGVAKDIEKVLRSAIAMACWSVRSRSCFGLPIDSLLSAGAPSCRRHGRGRCASARTRRACARPCSR